MRSVLGNVGPVCFLTHEYYLGRLFLEGLIIGILQYWLSLFFASFMDRLQARGKVRKHAKNKKASISQYGLNNTLHVLMAPLLICEFK